MAAAVSANPFWMPSRSLNQTGILFVAAAGNVPDVPEPNNDLVPHFPASYDAPNVIGVAATDTLDSLAVSPILA